MSELAGSVAVAQLGKLPQVVARRRMLAEMLTERIGTLEAIETPYILPGAQHSYWKYVVRTSESLPAEAVLEMAALLKERGIVSAPRYIQKPAFMCEIFQKRKTFGSSGFPFTMARPEVLAYDRERFPGTYAALERVLVVLGTTATTVTTSTTSPMR